MRNFIAEVFANRLGVGERVFNHIVKQPRRDGNGVEPHVSQDVGYFQRMDEIRFAGSALLPLVLARRKEVSAPQQIQIRLRMITLYLFANLFYSNHKKNGQLSVVRS